MRHELLSLVTYANWVSLAHCSIARFYRHRQTRAILCQDCYVDESHLTRGAYERVLRHYIYIGSSDNIIECTLCYASLIVSRPISTGSCAICPVVLDNFLDYILEEGDEPYNSEEPTIIAIEEVRV